MQKIIFILLYLLSYFSYAKFSLDLENSLSFSERRRLSLDQGPHFLSVGDLLGNGGDSRAQDFKARMIELSEALLFNDIGKVSIAEVARVYENSIKTEVYCVDKDLYLNGKEVQAINYKRYSYNEVVLNCHAYEDLGLEAKYLLVLHELLTLSRLNDRNYNLSISLFKSLKRILIDQEGRIYD